MMIKQAFKSGLLAAACTVSFAANANLINNGSFETLPDGTPANGGDYAGGTWKVYAGDQVLGWGGENSYVEFWDVYNDVTPTDGKYFSELSSDQLGYTTYSIEQTFATTAGTKYSLEFDYRARASNEESFNAIISDNGSLDETWLLNNHTTGAWSEFNGYFTAESDFTTLAFQTINLGTVGNFIDDVKVTAVSEPGTLALLGLGLAGLGFARRKA